MKNSDNPPQWYRDWVADYLVTFGRTTDTALAAAFARWWVAFERMRYTEEELQEATLSILTGAEPFPQFADRILERLSSEVRRIRSDKNVSKDRERLNETNNRKMDRETWSKKYAAFTAG